MPDYAPQIFKYRIHPFTLYLSSGIAITLALIALTGLYKQHIFHFIYKFDSDLALDTIDTAGAYLALCILMSAAIVFGILKDVTYSLTLYPDRMEIRRFGLRFTIPVKAIKGYRIKFYQRSGNLKKITLVMNHFIFPYCWHFKMSEEKLHALNAADALYIWCLKLANLTPHRSR